MSLPVVVADLHSALPAILIGMLATDPDLKVAYVMTDGGALPAAFSRTLDALAKSLVGVITVGQAFGGNLEAVTVHTGLLAARLADPPGASAYLQGGVVAYSNEAKVDLLGVPVELIERHGAVSPEVAEAMAEGAAERFGADLGVGITGIAGPDGGSPAGPGPVPRGGDRAAVHVDDPFAQPEADAEAARSGAAALIEKIENARQHVGGDARPVVRHLNLHVAIL